MSHFFEISPVIARYQTRIRRGVAMTLPQLPPALLAEYKHSAEGGINVQKSFVRWMLHNLFLLSGFLQVDVRVGGRSVYTQGAEILPWTLPGTPGVKPTLQRASGARLGARTVVRDIPPALEHVELTRVFFESHADSETFAVEGVVPASIADAARAVVDGEVFPFARNYFLNIPSLRDERLVDLLRGLENRVTEVATAELGQGRPVTFTHFRFQEMAIYFEMSGEHRTTELMDEIIETIQRNLKTHDEIVQLSPISYLVVSPGAEAHQIEARFQSIYFQARSLVLDYKLKVHTVSELPIRLNEVFRALEL